jgi:glycosyltransferase involved in cell wall biosynthesis
MRVGHNPAKQADKVAQPADLTVTVVNCIPMLTGYHEHSLDVLKACLGSIRENTDRPFDLMVFDNHSCPEVRDYLYGELKQGNIQYLVLSEENIGKIGAWNFMFGAAQGRYIAFADADISFRPGWLQGALDLFETFPNVGIVTGRPVRIPEEFFSNGLAWARKPGKHSFHEGQLLKWETYLEHALSLTMDEEKARLSYAKGKDYLVEMDGKQAYIGATHFQFIARSETLKALLPLPSEKPMRGERILDSSINEAGLLLLSNVEPYVKHMGNRLDQPAAKTAARKSRPGLLKRLLYNRYIKIVMFWIYNKIFQLYFYNVE